MGIIIPNRVSVTCEWIHEFSQLRKVPAHGELLVPALSINDDASLPTRSGFGAMWLGHWIGTRDFSSHFLWGHWSLTPLLWTSVAPPEKLSNFNFLSFLQFPFHLAYCMPSFESKGLVFKNNPKFEEPIRSLILWVQRVLLSFSSSLTGYQSNWGIEPSKGTWSVICFSDTLCGVLQPKVSEMLTLLPCYLDLEGWLQREVLL